MEDDIVSGPFIVLDPSTYTECGDLSSNSSVVVQGKQVLQAPHQDQQPLAVLREDGLSYPAPPAETLITWKYVDGILLCIQNPSSDATNTVTSSFTTANSEEHFINHSSSSTCLQQSPAANVPQSRGSDCQEHSRAYEEETITFSLDEAFPGPHSDLVTSTTVTVTPAVSTTHDAESAPTIFSSRSGMALRSVRNNEPVVTPYTSRAASPDGACEEVKGAVSAPGPSTIPGLSSCSLEVRLACRDALMPPRRVRRTTVPARGGQACPVCGRRFGSLLKIRKHVALCRGGGRKETISKSSSDDPVEKHACDLCDAVFPRPLLLQDHMSYMHNLERPFSCMHCPKKFYRPHDLKIHLNIHYNIKNYVCDVCGRQFNHLSNLKRHQRLHTGVCPYVCEICKQRFSQIFGLRQHVALHEKKSRTSIRSKRRKRKSYCQACGKTFDRKLDRDLHEKNEHSDETFECKSCMNTFSTLDLLKNHSCSRHRLRKRRKTRRKDREQDERTLCNSSNNPQLKSNILKNRTNTLTQQKSDVNPVFSSESTGDLDSTIRRNNKPMDATGLKVVDAELLGNSSTTVLEPLPKTVPQDSDTLVMYLTQGGDSMAYVLKKREEEMRASVLPAAAAVGHPPAIASYHPSTDETILINVEEQQLASCGGRGASSPLLSSPQGHFAQASYAKGSVTTSSSERSAVLGAVGEPVPARAEESELVGKSVWIKVEEPVPVAKYVATISSEVEGITIKEENIELEYGSDGETVHNSDHISFSNDVCIHTIVSDITHKFDDQHSEFVSSETFSCLDTSTGTENEMLWPTPSSHSNTTLKSIPTFNKKYKLHNRRNKVKTGVGLSSSQGQVKKRPTKKRSKTEKHSTKNVVLQRGTKGDASTDLKVDSTGRGKPGDEPMEKTNLEATALPAATKKEICCPECGKMFNRRWNYDQHYSLHFPAMNRYKCSQCNKTFAYRTTFTAHCASAHGDRTVQYPCSQCKKMLSSAGALRSHERRVHLKLKPHACHLCPRTFHVKSELAYHIRLHRREQPYVCYACGRTFSHSSHLHRHERQHTGERPHRCQLCPQTFIQAIGLSTHMKKHHRQQTPAKQQHLRPKPNPDAAPALSSRPSGSAPSGLTDTAPVISVPGGQGNENTVSVVYNPVQKGIVMPILEPEAAINIDHIYQELDLHAPPHDGVGVASATTVQAVHNTSSLGDCLIFNNHVQAAADGSGPPLTSPSESSAALLEQGQGATVTVLSAEDSVPVISIADTSSTSLTQQDAALFAPSLTGEVGQDGPSDVEVVSNLVNVNDVYNIILWRN